MATVTITWKAFGNKPERNRFVSSVTFNTEFDVTDTNRDEFFNVLYRNTNLYNGNLWDIIEPLLSPTRTHTSLSIGDEIKVDEVTYIISDCGFIKVEDAEIQMFGDAIFSVTEKVGA
jgi:hypothetical protein